MSLPRFAFVPVLGHEIHVTEWGDRRNPGLVMWHGLARTGRDFDELAAALSERYFVICPDTIGRGLSSWARDPAAEYSVRFMSELAVGLLDHYGLARVDWIGTSMGGLIGMRLASGAAAGRIGRLILNDIGPQVPQGAIDRILAYVGDLPEFATVSEGGAWLRATYAPFGDAPEGFWQRMMLSSLRRRGDGRLTLHYDPRIVVQFDVSAEELRSWERWARIEVPVYVVRGAGSDILTAEIAARMAEEGPRPEVREMAGCGHAPSLSRAEDVAMIAEMLAG